MRTLWASPVEHIGNPSGTVVPKVAALRTFTTYALGWTMKATPRMTRAAAVCSRSKAA